MLWSSSGLGRHAGRRAASRDDGSGRARRESSPKTASRIEGAAARGRYASRTSRPCARRSASVSTTSSWSSQLDSQTTQRKAETKQRQPHGRPSLSARALGFGLGLGWPWFSMRRLGAAAFTGGATPLLNDAIHRIAHGLGTDHLAQRCACYVRVRTGTWHASGER